MKRIFCITATAALLLLASLSQARGTPSSSFVPRGPEPHSSLSDKHHSNKGGRYVGGQASSRRGGHSVNPKSSSHYSHHTPSSN